MRRHTVVVIINGQAYRFYKTEWLRIIRDIRDKKIVDVDAIGRKLGPVKTLDVSNLELEMVS